MGLVSSNNRYRGPIGDREHHDKHYPHDRQRASGNVKMLIYKSLDTLCPIDESHRDAGEHVKPDPDRGEEG